MASTQLLRRSFRSLVFAGKSFACGHLFWEYIASLNPVSGPSMLPTFPIDGEWLLISKRYRYGRGVQVGDLVGYRIPMSPDADGLKRVLGMPGDYVLVNTPDSDNKVMTQVRFCT
jgi:inner membrane protease subunit 1